ncbi:alpha/beta hydrolase family protein [Steroidobacter sp.]|uniref:alpha/beta hydrolase family protein n=1 Tax=Steroidobacter sp. TaxID=1978227 RepID=UPI001A547926|nr:hypothetical protein [Steroidobacter sp.]MBL8267911.1 hypothetical protein [Steroidobacter sp.]
MLALAADDVRVPVHAFAGEARGPFQTGTVEELWIDTARDELSTSDPTDKRHLMVQIWYPASFKGEPTRAPYALSRELYPRDASTTWLDAAAAVRTNSVLNAPIVCQAAPFPVLVYSPGSGYPHFSGTFQTEFLASQGYVVISIGHTDVSRIERFPDGYVYKRDRNMPAVSAEQRQTLSATEMLQQWIRQISELQIPVHVADISFALDRLQSLNERRDSLFYRRLDLSRVGALGWSLGGVASLQASHDEPRIKAAVNLDGRLYIKAVETGTRRPILQMHANKERPADPGAAGMETMLAGDSLFWRMYSRTAADWYDLTVRGTAHRHFSDRTLFEAVDPALMYPRLAHEITNRYVLEFFDKYLRDSANTPFLSGARSWPDVDFVSHQGQP